MSNKNFRSYTLALTAGQEFTQNIRGNMYAVVDNTGDFTITFDETARVAKSTAGVGGEFESVYEQVTFLSTTTQTVVIVLGFGKYRDARATVNATVNTTISPSDTLVAPGDVVAGVAAVLAIAANADTKEVEICLPSTATNPVRVGPAGVTASSGSIIEPGMSKAFATEAALYVIRTASPDETVTVLALRRP
jgi:hypothetical protein